MRIAFLGNHQVSYSSESHHAASLEALGHEVLRLQEPKARLDGLDCDLFVWVHTHGWEPPHIEKHLSVLKRRGIPCITYHLDLYRGLSRWDRYTHHPYMTMLDHWFTVDRLMADWLNQNTAVAGHYLPAAVFGPECYLAEPVSPHGNDVIFVGSRGYHPEWPYRPQLIDWLRKTYGERFTHAGSDGDTGTIRGDALNKLYASSKIVVGDTLCLNFDYPDYWSDRVYETLGRGGFLIHPYIQGMERHFDSSKHLQFYQYGDFDELKTHIDWYLRPENAHWREAFRKAGHEHVKTHHTYTNRWETILDTVFA